ncbi:unnamed protein product, partial [Prorocentrum cordatum]
ADRAPELPRAMAFLCTAAVDALVPPCFLLAEALQEPRGWVAFAHEWLLPNIRSSFSHSLLDVPVLTLVRVACLVAVIRSSTSGGARPLVLAVAYPAFRISTLGYTCYIRGRLGELDFRALPSPALGYLLCGASLYACWISSVLPYLQACTSPPVWASRPARPRPRQWGRGSVKRCPRPPRARCRTGGPPSSATAPSASRLSRPASRARACARCRRTASTSAACGRGPAATAAAPSAAACRAALSS